MNLCLASSSAISRAAESFPIIDLDSTVWIQLGVFLLTAFVLSRCLFRPFLALRRAREAGTDGAREEAARLDREATARLADYDARMSRARADAEAGRLRLRAEAAAREREIAEAARREATKALGDAQVEVDLASQAARRQLKPRAEELARDIARRILHREVA